MRWHDALVRWPRDAGLAAVAAVHVVALAAPQFGAQVRAQFTDQQPALSGPQAQADALQPGTVPEPASGVSVQSELRASGHGITAVGTVQQQQLQADRLRNSGWVNELYGASDRGGWQLSAGKRIVAWDVGYGFRPNDTVEQEPRRTLLPITPLGRPLLMAEAFDATTAWALVLVNPTQPRGQTTAQEPALDTRVYRRAGAVDLSVYGRYGAHTRASIGSSAAWVANESVELHGSVRVLQAADTLQSSATGATLAGQNPWTAATVHRVIQALAGGTWTNAAQFSVLGEAWWDGTALSDTQWSAWTVRNRQLAALAGTPAPAAAVAGNLAWQDNALNASTNLRRASVYLRASWTRDAWQPALDVLVQPRDRGFVSTATLGWQGDRVRLDGGVRVYGGPSEAVLAQTPTRRIAFVASTWSF